MSKDRLKMFVYERIAILVVAVLFWYFYEETTKK